MKKYILDNIKESIEAKNRLYEDELLLDTICKVVDACIKAYKNGNKILVCGNGGSAADAQHMVGELVGRFNMERPGIPAISLNSNVVVMTAVCNDYDYDAIFEKQLVAMGNKGDILISISTSGNSANCMNAVSTAKDNGIITVGLTGASGGTMKEYCDYLINVPSDNTPRIQEMHILVIHLICGLIEQALFGEDVTSHE